MFAFYLEDIDSAFSGKKKEKQQEHHEQEQQQQQVCVRCEGSFSVPDEALDVAFDPTGSLLIVALIDHTILVLHADTGVLPAAAGTAMTGVSTTCYCWQCSKR